MLGRGRGGLGAGAVDEAVAPIGQRQLGIIADDLLKMNADTCNPLEHLLPVRELLDDLLPDFIIYRGVTNAKGGADYDDTNPIYCAGFFDSDWQPDPDLTWTHDGTPRAKPAAVPVPAVPLEPGRQPAAVPDTP